MALGEKRTWLIAYDISQPKRLGRVHRYIKTVAVPVQYSLYVTSETRLGIQRIRDELEKLIHPREDDVRIYQLPSRLHIVHYGRRPLPEGLIFAQAEPASGAWTALSATAREQT